MCKIQALFALLVAGAVAASPEKKEDLKAEGSAYYGGLGQLGGLGHLGGHGGYYGI